MTQRRSGFSLVELMIVVAIIGILAAIAIPNFVNMQLKAKRSELPGNVNGIKTAELAYEATFNTYVDCVAKPGTPSKTPVAWTVTGDGFSTIGWRPDGDVRGSYEVTNAGPTDFVVAGSGDMDGDGVIAVYTATATVDTTLGRGQENIY
ncbi:MAG TPA: type II secretion system protein [Myxococcota bacterium]|nr:type II secretion system protein [Myxococcota bacterium]